MFKLVNEDVASAFEKLSKKETQDKLKAEPTEKFEQDLKRLVEYLNENIIVEGEKLYTGRPDWSHNSCVKRPENRSDSHTLSVYCDTNSNSLYYLTGCFAFLGDDKKRHKTLDAAYRAIGKSILPLLTIDELKALQENVPDSLPMLVDEHINEALAKAIEKDNAAKLIDEHYKKFKQELESVVGYINKNTILQGDKISVAQGDSISSLIAKREPRGLTRMLHIYFNENDSSFSYNVSHFYGLGCDIDSYTNLTDACGAIGRDILDFLSVDELKLLRENTPNSLLLGGGDDLIKAFEKASQKETADKFIATEYQKFKKDLEGLVELLNTKVIAQGDKLFTLEGRSDDCFSVKRDNRSSRKLRIRFNENYSSFSYNVSHFYGMMSFAEIYNSLNDSYRAIGQDVLKLLTIDELKALQDNAPDNVFIAAQELEENIEPTPSQARPGFFNRLKFW